MGVAIKVHRTPCIWHKAGAQKGCPLSESILASSFGLDYLDWESLSSYKIWCSFKKKPVLIQRNTVSWTGFRTSFYGRNWSGFLLNSGWGFSSLAECSVPPVPLYFCRGASTFPSSFGPWITSQQKFCSQQSRMGALFKAKESRMFGFATPWCRLSCTVYGIN
jgi:hypothetical protein